MLAAAILPYFIGPAAAQDPYAQVARQADRPRAFHEAIVLPGTDAPQTIVAFRIPNNLLVFVQRDDRFVANPEVVVELFQDGTSIDERIWRGTHEVPSFEAAQDGTRDVEGQVQFDLVPGRYSYVLSLSDDAAGEVGTARPSEFVVPDFVQAVVGPPVFGAVDTRPDGRTELAPVNLSGNAPFGEPTSIVVPLDASEPDDRLVFRVFRIDRERWMRSTGGDEPYELGAGDALIADDSVDVGVGVAVGELERDCTCWSTDVGTRGQLIPLDLETESLENGVYLLDLELLRGGERYSVRTTFETLWRGMPFSLYDVEVAIRNLTFIESRDRVKEMLRGSHDERLERFRLYWKQRDPTPGTVYNELMAEYYRRIDAAARRFQTGRAPYPDGLRTDAARIYVVHGPPDDVSNSFPPSGGVRQIWTYLDGRRFVFRAASSLDALELEEEHAPGNSGR